MGCVRIKEREVLMSEMASVLDKAVSAGDVPFAVGLVATEARVTHSHAVGNVAPGRKAGPGSATRITGSIRPKGSLLSS